MQKEITLQEIISSGKKEFIGYEIIINNDEEDVLHSFKCYNFSKCIFIGKFKGIKLYSANLSGADLSFTDLSHANLYHANLSGANLSGADLFNADLSGADLYGANLYRADLSNANLYNANLYGANLYSVNLSHANLSHANLTGVNLYNADLSGVKYNKYTKIPSPAAMLLVQWQNVSDDLCLELMRYDAANHPSPDLFIEWANGGSCPYEDINVQRAANFKEIRNLYSPGPSKHAYEIMQMLLKEKCKFIEEEE